MMIRLFFWCIFVIGLMAATAVLAQTIPAGKPVTVRQLPTCNTVEEARDILEHGKKSNADMIVRFNHYTRMEKDGEPVCGMYEGPIIITNMVERVDVGPYKFTIFMFRTPGGEYVGFSTVPISFGNQT